MAARPAPRTLTVLGSKHVTPSMLRVTLGGEGLGDFPSGQEGGYVKLRLPPAPGTSKPIVRTYTIRAQRPGEIDVDFALHEAADGSAGPATRWALHAATGDRIKVGGPGAAKPLPDSFGFYLVAGDMTAIPAIAVNLAALPAEAKGLVVIEIPHEDDRQPLDAPEGVTIRWLVNPVPGTRPDLLVNEVRAAEWPQEQTYGWVACEFSAMRALRGYLREECGLGPDRLYISSYWKSGLDEDTHKGVKRADAEEQGALA